MKGKIFVVTHEEKRLVSNQLYQPISVGRDFKIDGFISDNTGDNISKKNDFYCELTAYYWIWKNALKDLDYVGICHYRRFFNFQSFFFRKNIEYFLDYESAINKICLIKNNNKIQDWLSKYDMLLCKKSKFSKSISEFYFEKHYASDWEIMLSVLKEKYPDYYQTSKSLFYTKKIRLANMIITSSSIFNQYCKWLFDIIFEIENRIDIIKYDNYQKRIFGFLAERLQNLYVEHNKFKFKEIDKIIL